MATDELQILVIYLNEVHAQYKLRLGPLSLKHGTVTIGLAQQGIAQLRGHWFDLVIWSEAARRGLSTRERAEWDQFLSCRLRNNGIIWEL